MEKTIKVVVKEVNELCEVREIENTLEALKTIVEGHIEVAHFRDCVSMICNEEGKFDGLLPNFATAHDIIVGNVLFTAVDEEGDGRSLTEDEVQLVLELFSK